LWEKYSALKKLEENKGRWWWEVTVVRDKPSDPNAAYVSIEIPDYTSRGGDWPPYIQWWVTDISAADDEATKAMELFIDILASNLPQ